MLNPSIERTSKGYALSTPLMSNVRPHRPPVMHRLVQLLTVGFFCAASARAGDSPVVEGNGIGTLRIGMRAEAVKASGSLVADRNIGDGEGGTVRSMRLRLGAGTAEAEVVDGKVWRVSVRSSTLRTARDFGVGTKLKELLQEKGWQGGFGEGYLYIWNSKYCGLSFELNFDPHSGSAASPDWDQDALALLPPSTSVQSILVLGCSK